MNAAELYAAIRNLEEWYGFEEMPLVFIPTWDEKQAYYHWLKKETHGVIENPDL